MGKLFKYILIALFLFLFGSWIMVVAKSCGKETTKQAGNASGKLNNTLKDMGITDDDDEGLLDKAANKGRDLAGKAADGGKALADKAVDAGGAVVDKATDVANKAKDAVTGDDEIDRYDEDGDRVLDDEENEDALLEAAEKKAAAEKAEAARKAASKAEAERTAAQENAFEKGEDDTDVTTSKNKKSLAYGMYMVVAGSFKSKANAKSTLTKLEKLGYDDAELVQFDFSDYYSLVVGRSNDLNSVRSLSKELNRKGVEAYVHKKRMKK